jgi:hypothetical protein
VATALGLEISRGMTAVFRQKKSRRDKNKLWLCINKKHYPGNRVVFLER